jgi:hypothetical protein
MLNVGITSKVLAVLNSRISFRTLKVYPCRWRDTFVPRSEYQRKLWEIGNKILPLARNP